MGVPQRCPIPSRLVEETTSTFVCSQPLAKSEICLQAPVGVLVDPQPSPRSRENAGKTTRLTCSVTLSALSRMARSSGTDSSTSSPRAGRICSDSRGTVTSAFCALMRIVRAAFLTVFRRVFVKRVCQLRQSVDCSGTVSSPSRSQSSGWLSVGTRRVLFRAPIRGVPSGRIIEIVCQSRSEWVPRSSRVR